MMFMFSVVFGKDLRDPFCRIITCPVARRLCPIKYGLQPLLDASCSFGLAHPDGRQCLQYIGGIDHVDVLCTENGKCVILQSLEPLRRVLRIAEGLALFRMYLS